VPPSKKRPVGIPDATPEGTPASPVAAAGPDPELDPAGRIDWLVDGKVGDDERRRARSFGIRGLQERAATVGGWIDLSSSARGTTLILSIPIAGAAKDSPVVQDTEAESAHDPSAWGDL